MQFLSGQPAFTVRYDEHIWLKMLKHSRFGKVYQVKTKKTYGAKKKALVAKFGNKTMWYQAIHISLNH